MHVYSKPNKRVLIVTAVASERDALLRGIGNVVSLEVLVAGVGMSASATHTAMKMAQNKYDLVVSAGIGGGFRGRAEVSSLVVSNEIIAADLGVQTTEGFSSLDELGLGSTHYPVNESLVTQFSHLLGQAGLAVSTGAALTVSTVTGTDETATELVMRIPHATSEAMEGFAVATVADAYGLPFIELRAISNVVGLRDRAAWKMKEAMELLTIVGAQLAKEWGD